MNKDTSFMNVPQCNASVYLFLFLALEAIRIVSAFIVFEDFSLFELEAIPSWYRLLELRTNWLSNSDLRITSFPAFFIPKIKRSINPSQASY